MGQIAGLEHQRLEGAEGVKERLTINVGASPGIVTIRVGGTDGVAAEETIEVSSIHYVQLMARRLNHSWRR